MKSLDIFQIQALLLIYKKDLEFVNADVMNWSHEQAARTPPSRDALLGYALLKCKDHQIYLSNTLYDQFDGHAEFIQETDLVFSLNAIATIEAVFLSIGFYSWQAIQAARKKVSVTEKD